MRVSLLLAILVAPAQANELLHWEFLHDHLLVEAIDGDVEKAGAAYRDLVHNLSADDPTRAEALYWLGRVSYAQGETEEAGNALREGVRTGVMRQRSLELLGQMALEEHSVKTTPSTWDFETEVHGFVHPWRYADKGSILRSDGVLRWLTNIDQQLEDRLVVGFDRPSPTPQGAVLRIRSLTIPAHLQLVVTDTTDRRYVFNQVIKLEPGAEFVDIDCNFEQLRDGENKRQLDPRQIDQLILVDRSNHYGQNGNNEILIDRFTVY